MKLMCVTALTGAVLMSQANAAHVAIFDQIAAAVGGNLQADGHSYERLSASEVEAGALISGGYEAFLFGRAYDGVISQSFVDSVGTFMDYGGGLVTEFDGASILFSGYHESYALNASNPQLGLIDGTIGAGSFLASGTRLYPVGSHPVTDRVGDPFHAGGGTQYFFTTYGLNNLEVDILATYTGNGSEDFPATTFGGVLGGVDGSFVSLMFDAQDNPFDLDVRRLLFDAVEYVAGTVTIPVDPPEVAPVPLPASAWMLIAGTGLLSVLRVRRTRRKDSRS